MSYRLTLHCDYPQCERMEFVLRPRLAEKLNTVLPDGWGWPKRWPGKPQLVFCPEHAKAPTHCPGITDPRCHGVCTVDTRDGRICDPDCFR